MRHVCMIAYTNYSSDQRVRREAEAVASLPGHSVTVLTAKEQQPPRHYEKGGVQIRELDISKYRGGSGSRYIYLYIRFTILGFIECTKLLARKSIDVLHVHNMPNFLVFAGLIPFLAGKPILLDVHDTMVETYAAKFSGNSGSLLAWALRLEESVCCRMARRIVCVNEIQKAALVGRKIPEQKVLVAMNVPDPGMFDHHRSIRAGSDGDGKFRMIYHGSVTKRVGVDQAIHAVSKLDGSVPGWELHVAGEGDDMEEIRALSVRLGLEDRIHFPGRVPLEGMISILERMDLGIVPNGRNIATDLMLPVKMLECIALGIPVVAPRLRTISHYFTEDMVYFFEPDDVDSMADAILAASSDGEERARRAHEARRFLDKYGWETHKTDFLEMYKAL
jgi:glycosyltransferase involved in cell wall biosynthesis